MHWLSIAVLGGMFVLATALPINMGLIAFVGAFFSRYAGGGYGCQRNHGRLSG